VKKLYTILFLVLLLSPLYGQDPQFSQFYSNYLYLAPSFSGLIENNRVALNYRKQWPEIAHGYNTYSASFDKYFEKFRSGLGILFLRDEAGSGRLRSTNIGIQYSFDIKVNNFWHIRPGMHFLYTERAIDFENLLWADQISVNENAPATAEVLPVNHVGDLDFSTSAMTYSDRYWLGVCVDHLLKPNHSLYFYEDEDGNPAHVPIKYSVFGGTKFTRHEHLLRPIPTTLQFAFLFKSQGKYNQLDLGVYFYRSPIVLGFWFRGIPFYDSEFNRDAFTILAGYKIKDLNIGYSYDFTISRLISKTGGSHEISLSYTFKTKARKRKPKMLPCPEF
jgi:type IX secretion system PorP/SprF family membrane protein